METVTIQKLKNLVESKPYRFEDEKYFTNYRGAHPDDPVGFYLAGLHLDGLHNIDSGLGREEEVIDALEKALSLGFNDKYKVGKVHNILGYNYFRRKKWDDALRHLDAYFAGTPEKYIFPWAYRYRAKALVRVRGVTDTDAVQTAIGYLTKAAELERTSAGKGKRVVAEAIAREIFDEALLALDQPAGGDQQADALLAVLRDAAPRFGMEGLVPDIMLRKAECAKNRGDIKAAREDFRSLAGLPGIPEKTASDIERVIRELDADSRKTRDVIAENAMLRSELGKVKEDIAKDRLANDPNNHQKIFEQFFGIYWPNCPKTVGIALNTAEHAYASFIGVNVELDYFSVFGEYQKAIEILIDDIITKPYRAYCDKHPISYKNTGKNDDEKYLRDAWEKQHTLTIGKLLWLRNNPRNKTEYAYTLAFRAAMNGKDAARSLMANDMFWQRLKELNDLPEQVFSASRHKKIIPKKNIGMIRTAITGDYKNKDCVLYVLIKARSEM